MITGTVFPVKVDTTPDESMYVGLSKQNLDYHQAIGELIDNAISASTQPFFTVEVHITQDGDIVHTVVADKGTGISLGDLRDRVMRLGGKGTNIGRLNEHGYGLKNALCRLTENRLPWSILTRDSEAAQSDMWYRIKGPFKSHMVVDRDDGAHWTRDIVRAHGDVGARVYVDTSFNYFKTLYRAADRFDSLIPRLLEHLGVMYRGYLQADPTNTMWLRWRPSPSTDYTDAVVKAIEIPWGDRETRELTVDVDGRKVTAQYTWGWLDTEKAERTTGTPYPLRIYYKGNQRTQGVDVRVRGRVILSHALSEIWPGIPRHNDLNAFVGELLLDAPEFATVNNKTNLNDHNPYWQVVKDLLQDTKYQPQKFSTIRRQDEGQIKDLLAKHLEALVPGSQVHRDFPTWEGAGVKIDLLHKYANADEHVYEVKARELTPQDVYQLVMYWDGRAKAGVTPKLGRLVGVDIPDSVEIMIAYWNARKDANGTLYRLEVRTSKQLLPEARTPPAQRKKGRKPKA